MPSPAKNNAANDALSLLIEEPVKMLFHRRGRDGGPIHISIIFVCVFVSSISLF
jgi:hypothetical protein